MPTKYFCDVCGLETERNFATEKLKRTIIRDERNKEGFKYRLVEIEVDVYMRGKEHGVICKDCLLKVVNNGIEVAKDGSIVDDGED